MDCRRTLGLGLGLLLGAVGCTHRDAAPLPIAPPQLTKAPPASAPVETLPPGAEVKKAPDLPKREPKAATCVARGDWQAGEAEAPYLPEPVRQEKREEARKLYEQALKDDPRCLQAYLSLAKLYLTMRDHAHAEATYQKAAQAFPSEARVFFEMGQCYGGEKEWDKAVQAHARAAEIDPGNHFYVEALGWMQARAGHFDESLNTFRQIYDEPEAHYQLARMLDHLGQADLCRRHLQVVLDKSRSADTSDQAKAMLAKLDGHPTDGVQPAAFVTSAKPPTDSGPIAPRPAGDSLRESPTLPAAKGCLLPPPPHIPIRYEDPAAPASAPAPAPASLPPLPGPDMK